MGGETGVWSGVDGERGTMKGLVSRQACSSQILSNSTKITTHTEMAKLSTCERTLLKFDLQRGSTMVKNSLENIR